MGDILSASTVMQLQNSMIDSGANFLIGAATSPFDPNFSENQAGVMSVVGGTIGVASSAANIAGSAINTAALSANIVAEGIAYLSQRITSYVAECTVKLLTLPTAYLAEVTKAKISEGMKEELKMSNIMKRLTQDSEKNSEEKNKENEKESENKVKKDMTKKVKEISYKATTAINKATYQMNSIAAYVQKGPEWMSYQVTKYSDLVMEQTGGFLGSTVESFDKTKKDWAYSMADKAAKIALDKTKREMLAKMKIQLDKIEQAKQKAMNKAKAAVAQALMKIKGLLGG